ncbi:MAG: DUF1800 family protein [Candidatus Rokubacteria bacterium]|nr:DUF1800 family protein [Candidatus Rokubacteria bacterium]
MKKPLEVVASAVRALDGQVFSPRRDSGGAAGGAALLGGGFPLSRQAASLGEPLYEAQPPTGHPDVAEAWVNTGALLGRMNFALGLAHNRFPATRVDLGKALVGVDRRRPEDGLSMVVPHGDPDYYPARGSIAIARPAAGTSGTTIDLDGLFGLHPAMEPLTALRDARRLAVVHACGSPDTTRSHFDAQDYMESGTPGIKSTGDGWLARGLQALPSRGASPFRAVAIRREPPVDCRACGFSWRWSQRSARCCATR